MPNADWWTNHFFSNHSVESRIIPAFIGRSTGFLAHLRVLCSDWLLVVFVLSVEPLIGPSRCRGDDPCEPLDCCGCRIGVRSQYLNLSSTGIIREQNKDRCRDLTKALVISAAQGSLVFTAVTLLDR